MKKTEILQDISDLETEFNRESSDLENYIKKLKLKEWYIHDLHNRIESKLFDLKLTEFLTPLKITYGSL